MLTNSVVLRGDFDMSTAPIPIYHRTYSLPRVGLRAIDGAGAARSSGGVERTVLDSALCVSISKPHQAMACGGNPIEGHGSTPSASGLTLTTSAHF